MWSVLGWEAISQGAQSFGFTASTGVALESLALANKYVIVPAFKSVDIETTRKIWGEEAALKTEQDWKEVEEWYITPVLNYTDWIGGILKQEDKKKNETQEEKKDENLSIPQSQPNLIYSKEGNVRDISKVGQPGNIVKIESDEKKKDSDFFKSAEIKGTLSHLTPKEE